MRPLSIRLRIADCPDLAGIKLENLADFRHDLSVVPRIRYFLGMIVSSYQRQ